MSWAETQAAYRFYSNESVIWGKLLTAHANQVEQRIIKSEEAIILCLQDTTELDFNGQETEGLGLWCAAWHVFTPNALYSRTSLLLNSAL